MNHTNLIQTFPIISDQISAAALSVVLRELGNTMKRGVSGDIVEFGCYIGTTSLFIRRMLNQEDTTEKRSFHVYDSFAGLPPKSNSDESVAGVAFQAGELRASKKQFLNEFYKAGLKPPILHKGWFHELKPAALPPTIAYAFLDGDFYESILASLHLVWPRLVSGGKITIDDYDREALPGVTRAVTQFFQSQPIAIRHEHHIAIIQKGAT